jgi:hypothetical protein
MIIVVVVTVVKVVVLYTVSLRNTSDNNVMLVVLVAMVVLLIVVLVAVEVVVVLVVDVMFVVVVEEVDVVEVTVCSSGQPVPFLGTAWISHAKKIQALGSAGAQCVRKLLGMACEVEMGSGFSAGSACVRQEWLGSLKMLSALGSLQSWRTLIR